MDWTRFKFALPTTLVVATFVSANACNHEYEHCVDLEKQSKCEDQPSCDWIDGMCENICYTLDNQSDCTAVEGCFWDPSAVSETGGSETGETGGMAGSCHEPHT